MNIHEYQAKQLFKEFGLPVLDGYKALNLDEVKEVLDQHFEDGKCVVKAQIHAGGRGKAGGVKLANSKEEALKYASDMLGMTLITKQTGPEGKVVNRLFIEKQAKAVAEYYLSMTIDTNIGKCTYVACLDGGTSIEEIAEEQPEKIHKLAIEPSVGFEKEKAIQFTKELGIKDELVNEYVDILEKIYKLFIGKDCSLVEINPLAVVDNHLVCLDAKINLDEAAFFRQQENLELRDLSEENPLEATAKEYGMSYVSLNGNIGCICNGAGLGMSSMDTINYYGGHPANFLDCGGSITVEKAHKAFELVANENGVEGIVINIFGGIARTNLIAEGVVEAIKDLNYTKPVVARIEGNNEALAQEILASAPSNVVVAHSCSEACEKMINLLEKK